LDANAISPYVLTNLISGTNQITVAAIDRPATRLKPNSDIDQRTRIFQPHTTGAAVSDIILAPLILLLIIIIFILWRRKNRHHVGSLEEITKLQEELKTLNKEVDKTKSKIEKKISKIKKAKV